jgi:protein-arginine kinase activator protein McsA
MNSLCQQCHERPASVFLTQIVDNNTSQSQLCADCARALAERDGLMSNGLANGVSHPQTNGVHSLPFDEMMRSLFASDNLFSNDVLDDEGMFPGDEDLADEIDEADEANALNPTLEDDGFDPFATGRDDNSDCAPFANIEDEVEFENAIVCPRCALTWERLKNEGRAGCAGCYDAFAPQLSEVMRRLQKGETHVGKIPRAREKRRRRLELLRQQRDNRLELLNTRLAEAVRAERYEDAACLRDKIRIVASTIVREES